MLLASCQSLGPRGEAPPSVDRARSLERSGDHAGAARIYEALAAQNSGTEQNAYLLLAARAYLQARRRGGCAARAGTHRPAADAGADIRAADARRGARARAQSERTRRGSRSRTIPATHRSGRRRRAIWGCEQRAAFATGRPADGVRADIARERFLTNADERTQARVELLSALRSSSERGMRVEPRPATDPIVRGWLELGPLAASAARNPTSATPDIEAWRTRISHSSGERCRAHGAARVSDVEPRQAIPHVALLLPLSGRAAAAGNTRARWIHDRVLPGAGLAAPAPSRVRHRGDQRRGSHHARARGRRGVHRRSAHAG